MSGKVIQTLRSSPLATSLSEAELRILAGCGRIYQGKMLHNTPEYQAFMVRSISASRLGENTVAAS